MRRITPNFTVEEFEHSNVATRKGIDNRVPTHLSDNLNQLATAMQRVRDFFGEPVVISSGYRCKELNDLVGGAPTSHHRFAAAADWRCDAFGSPLECADAIARHMELWHISQVIHEYGAWVHCSILPVASVNKIITIDRLGPRTGLHPAR